MRKNLISKQEYLESVKSGKKSKYKNSFVYTEEGVFRSKAEYARWKELKLLEKSGEIFHLEREVSIPLIANGNLVGHYCADAVYSKSETIPYKRSQNEILFFSNAIVEDTKGGEMRTDLFKWKAKHFLAQYGFDIKLNKAYKG